MISPRRFAALNLALGLAGLLVVAGCSRSGPVSVGGSQPPETTLAIRSSRADSTGLILHIAWSGTDADGEVMAFRTRLDALEWRRVGVSDTVLEFRPHDPTGSKRVPEKHTFSVAAVDDDGLADPTPATVTFSHRNILPETEIITGPAGIAGPMVFFEWRGWDYDGVIIGYGARLHRWEYDEWILVWEGDFGPEEVSIWLGPLAGRHRFEVWSIDDAGEADPTPAVRDFSSNPSCGPRLTVRTSFVGTHTFRGQVWGSAHDIPVPVLDEGLVTFDWMASAEDYGGIIVGYSFAYDDTSNWGVEFSLDDTHFETEATLGEHSFYVSALDNGSMLVRGRICFEVFETTLDEYILIVDDFTWRESQELWGTDADRDAFYDSLTMTCARPTVQWDALENMEAGLCQPPDVETIAAASTVIWYFDHEETALDHMFDPYFEGYNVAAGYVRAGGNLILCGNEGLRQITDDYYPIVLSPADTTEAAVFLRDQMGVGYGESSGTSANKNSPWTYGYCFYGAVPSATSIPESRVVQLEPMYIDSLGKWPLYDSPHPIYSRAGLPMVEKLEAYQGEPIEPYVIDSFLNMSFEGQPCAVIGVTGTGRGSTCYLGFPLYYLQTPQVTAAFEKLLELYGEPGP